MFTKNEDGKWFLANSSKMGYVVNQELIAWIEKTLDSLKNVTRPRRMLFSEFLEKPDRISGKIFFIGDMDYPIRDVEMKVQLEITLREVKQYVSTLT